MPFQMFYYTSYYFIKCRPIQRCIKDIQGYMTIQNILPFFFNFQKGWLLGKNQQKLCYAAVFPLAHEFSLKAKVGLFFPARPSSDSSKKYVPQLALRFFSQTNAKVFPVFHFTIKKSKLSHFHLSLSFQSVFVQCFCTTSVVK